MSHEDPLNRFSRSEVAAGAEHFRRVADRASLSPKDLRKAEKREMRAMAAQAEDQADAETIATLDRLAGQIQATRTLAPSRQVRGLDVPTLPCEPAPRFTAADVEQLRARIRQDDAALANRGSIR